MNGGVFAVSRWVSSSISRKAFLFLRWDVIRISLRRKEIVPTNLLFLKGHARLKSPSAPPILTMRGRCCLLIAYSEARHQGVFFFFFFWMYVYNNSISFLVIKSLVSLKKRCQEKKSKVIGTRNHHPTICIPLVLFYLEIPFDLMWWKPSQINMNVVCVCVCVCCVGLTAHR